MADRPEQQNTDINAGLYAVLQSVEANGLRANRNAVRDVLAKAKAAMLTTSPRQTEGDVERVARAICTESGGDPDEDVLPETPRWVGYIPEANAAIAAMPRQTDGLVEALRQIAAGSDRAASTCARAALASLSKADAP